MAPFEHALREYQMSSYFTTKGVPNAHNVQVHATELSVLNRAYEINTK
jgi:hypothetical protein